MGTKTKTPGDVAEARFLHEALKRGYSVSDPFGDDDPYDFIIDNGKKLFKIQVKSTTTSRKDAFKTGLRNPPYQEGDFKFAAIYVTEVDDFYIIPEEHCIEKQSICLAGKLSHYRGAWYQLNEGSANCSSGASSQRSNVHDDPCFFYDPMKYE